MDSVETTRGMYISKNECKLASALTQNSLTKALPQIPTKPQITWNSCWFPHNYQQKT